MSGSNGTGTGLGERLILDGTTEVECYGENFDHMLDSVNETGERDFVNVDANTRLDPGDPVAFDEDDLVVPGQAQRIPPQERPVVSPMDRPGPSGGSFSNAQPLVQGMGPATEQRRSSNVPRPPERGTNPYPPDYGMGAAAAATGFQAAVVEPGSMTLSGPSQDESRWGTWVVASVAVGLGIFGWAWWRRSQNLPVMPLVRNRRRAKRSKGRHR